MSDVRIEAISVGRLEEFATESLASRRDASLVPISLHRARAWARNPCAAKEDPSLLVAYDGDRCVGYLGMMPGLLETAAGREQMLWPSSWLVHPQYRGRGLGGRLLEPAFRVRRDMAASSASAGAAHVLVQMGFEAIGPLRYLEADLNRIDLLSSPWRAIRRLARARRAAATPGLDRCIEWSRRFHKAPLYMALASATAARWRSYRTVLVKRVGSRWVGEGVPRGSRARFVRDASVVNWMLQHRWVTTDRAGETRGYHFCDWRPMFDFLPYEIHRASDDSYLGFAVLRIAERHHNRVLTLLDYDLHDPEPLLPLTVRAARQFLADKILLPQEVGDSVAALRPLDRLFSSRSRTFYYYRSSSSSPSEIDLRLPDGDYAFT